ncbi:hypothetical protein [Leifsonia sp. A12D58]|uniref:DUF7657 domain-containing protein n=1 Tax=Leifsonia sp. A12D58 TaxID=3397674 RepID=UPI0039DF2DE3
MRQSFVRWAIFPIAVLVAFIALVGFDVSGSSIAVFSSQQEADGLLAGTPRGIRSDEFLLQTPNAISSVEQGLPANAWIGLNNVDQSVAAGGGPTHDWGAVFSPQEWGYLFLGASRGVSFAWWWPSAIALWGCFALFGILTRRPLLSTGLAIAATFTPYAGWWQQPSLTLGHAAFAAAAVLGAWLVRRTSWAIGLSVLAGLSGAVFALTLYPPWQVSIALVIVALGVGFFLDRRIPWRRVAWTAGVAVLATGGVAIAWMLQHQSAIQSVANTYYPGQRKTVAGTGSLEALLSAPLNFWMVGDAGASLGADGRVGPYANLSESASSWLPLPVIALGIVGAVFLVVGTVRRRRHPRTDLELSAEVLTSSVTRSSEPVWMLSLLSAVILLLLAWMLLPLPEWVGQVTQLQRVQPSRTPLALGFAAIMMVAVATTVQRRPRVWGWPWLLGASLLTAVVTVWSAERLPWDTALVSMKVVALSGLVLGALFAMLLGSRKPVVASVLLGIFAFVSWVQINPVQQGIAPLADDSLVRELHAVTGESDNPRTMVFGDFFTVAKVRSAGQQSISGTTPYPDADLMNALAPEQEELWNNYAQYRWIPGAAGTSPIIERVNGSGMTMTIDPCDAVIAEKVDPGWAVSETPLEAPCLELVSTAGTDRTYYIYEVATR